MTNDIRYNSYDEVFGHPQPGFDEIAWKEEHPGFPYAKLKTYGDILNERPVIPLNYFTTGSITEITDASEIETISGYLHIETEDNIGLACINPSFEFHVTDGNSELVEGATTTLDMGHLDPDAILDVSKEDFGIGPYSPDAILLGDNIGIGGESPSKKLDIHSGLNKEDFTEELKALHYDLDRAKDVPTREKLIKEFTDREFKKVWNSRPIKERTVEFFIKTWDLIKSRNSSIDDCDYAEFLEDYFDESDYDDGGV